MKTLLNLFVILTCFIIHSCATIKNGSNQTIRIEATPNNSSVLLNNKEIGLTPLEYNLPRKTKEAKFEIKADGYETSEYKMQRFKKGQGMGNLYLWVFGGSSLGSGLALASLSNSSANWVVGGIILTSLAAISTITDASTQANWAFRRDNIRSDLVRLPAKIIKDSCLSVNFTEAEFQISAGLKIGEEKTKDISSPILWKNGMGINDREIVEMLNKEMEFAGYNVSAKENSKSKLPPVISIQSSVLSITYDVDQIQYVSGTAPAGNGFIRVNYDADCITTCEMKVKWVLKDRNDKTLLEKIILTSTTTSECGGKLAILKSYKNNLFNLTHDSDFQKQLKIKNQQESSFPILDQLLIKNVPAPNLSESSIKNELKEIIKSVVTIFSDNGHGSGFFISENGLIMTNYHVIQGSANCSVKLNNGVILSAKVITQNINKDLAVLKIDGLGYKPLKLSSNAEIELAGDVYAIGTPSDLDLGQTITKGIVSGKRRIEDNIYIQTDLSISPGNSGGPLINSQGLVIGIITSKIIREGVEGIGFSIPAYQAIDNLNIQYE